MKIRILALCLALAMALTLAGCKKEKKTAPATTPDQTTLEQTTPPETTPMDTTAVTVPVDTNPVVPQDRVEGTYEQWLAAASVQVTTMLMYPDCQVKGVYALSETDFDKKMDSKGVAIQIINAGSELWILSTPLEEERSLAQETAGKPAGSGRGMNRETGRTRKHRGVQIHALLDACFMTGVSGYFSFSIFGIL